VPEGRPLVDVTAAVRVMDWPKTVGFVEDVRVVVVKSPLTVWVRVAEVLELKLESAL